MDTNVVQNRNWQSELEKAWCFAGHLEELRALRVFYAELLWGPTET